MNYEQYINKLQNGDPSQKSNKPKDFSQPKLLVNKLQAALNASIHKEKSKAAFYNNKILANDFPLYNPIINHNNPMVSIIIPCFNDGVFLSEAVYSVLNQPYRPIEIIIINDGSTDSLTNEILSKLNYPYTKVLNINNSGPAVARNVGIKSALGKYILPLDADDKIESTYIKKAIEVLERHPEIGIVYCEADYFYKLTGKWDLPNYSLERMLSDNIIFVSAFFKKEVWERVGGYSENLIHGLEDYDFWLSIIELGYQVYQIPEVLFYYRIKNNSRTSKFNSRLEVVKETYDIIYKNHNNLFNQYQHLYAKVLRESLIDLIYQKREYEMLPLIMKLLFGWIDSSKEFKNMIRAKFPFLIGFRTKYLAKRIGRS